MTENSMLIARIAGLEDRLALLLKRNAELEVIAANANSKDAQREYKDRVFRFIFGNPQKKEWALSLYNAVNGTAYTNPEDISFNMLGNAVYMRMRNDVSFIFSSEMSLWEHQSTYNPNIPMRFFLYAGGLYEKYIATSNYYQYSSSLQPIPRPKCVCFYNGVKEQPEELVLKLSDAYDGEGDIEVKVSMRNINYGKNLHMMEACKPLSEYAWLVERVRLKQKELADFDAAVDAVLDEMPEDFEIRGFLLENRAEVKKMLLTEYNEVKVLEQERKEGIEEGKKEGIEETNERVAKDMLSTGTLTVSFISQISHLPEESVRNLANTMGVAVLS